MAISDEKRREVAKRTRETEISKDTIRPGDVYEYHSVAQFAENAHEYERGIAYLIRKAVGL